MTLEDDESGPVGALVVQLVDLQVASMPKGPMLERRLMPSMASVELPVLHMLAILELPEMPAPSPTDPKLAPEPVESVPKTDLAMPSSRRTSSLCLLLFLCLCPRIYPILCRRSSCRLTYLPWDLAPCIYRHLCWYNTLRHVLSLGSSGMAIPL